MILIIIGLFNAVHFITGVAAYDKYPLRYGDETRCAYVSQQIPVEGGKPLPSEKEQQSTCLEALERERINTRVDDLEKSIAFTGIGALIFGMHFYFARRQKTS